MTYIWARPLGRPSPSCTMDGRIFIRKERTCRRGKKKPSELGLKALVSAPLHPLVLQPEPAPVHRQPFPRFSPNQNGETNQAEFGAGEATARSSWHGGVALRNSLPQEGAAPMKFRSALFNWWVQRG